MPKTLSFFSVILPAFLWCIFCGSLLAQNEVIPEKKVFSPQELLAVLDEATELATKTKLNNDYAPGMVIVLQGRYLESLGIQKCMGGTVIYSWSTSYCKRQNGSEGYCKSLFQKFFCILIVMHKPRKRKRISQEWQIYLGIAASNAGIPDCKKKKYEHQDIYPANTEVVLN